MEVFNFLVFLYLIIIVETEDFYLKINIAEKTDNLNNNNLSGVAPKHRAQFEANGVRKLNFDSELRKKYGFDETIFRNCLTKQYNITDNRAVHDYSHGQLTYAVSSRSRSVFKRIIYLEAFIEIKVKDIYDLGSYDEIVQTRKRELNNLHNSDNASSKYQITFEDNVSLTKQKSTESKVEIENELSIGIIALVRNQLKLKCSYKFTSTEEEYKSTSTSELTEFSLSAKPYSHKILVVDTYTYNSKFEVVFTQQLRGSVFVWTPKIDGGSIRHSYSLEDSVLQKCVEKFNKEYSESFVFRGANNVRARILDVNETSSACDIHFN